MTWEMKLDERYDAGREDGRKAELGRQIQRKLQKGKSISQIADECEESEAVIREMIEMENK